MEPPDLNERGPSGSGTEPVLDAWLRQPPPELPDNGFSTQVLRALPPPRPAVAGWRWGSCLLAFIAGVVVAVRAVMSAGGAAAVTEAWQEQLAALQPALSPTLISATGAALLLAFAATALSLFYALGTSRRLMR